MVAPGLPAGSGGSRKRTRVCVCGEFGTIGSPRTAIPGPAAVDLALRPVAAALGLGHEAHEQAASEMRRFLVDSRSLPQPQPQDPQPTEPSDEDEPNMANDEEEDVFNPDEIMCDPKNSFSKFDVDKLASLTTIYHADFSSGDRAIISHQLETYIHHVRRHVSFSTCKDLESLARKMVETEKYLVFPLVYKLIELALLLPVSTASVERVFSAMKIIKSKLRNKINNDWLNDLMICYTERDIFKQLDDNVIAERFQAMKKRKGYLPRKPRHN